MIHLQENIDLTLLNTFGLQCTARYFVSIQKAEQLKALLELDFLQKETKLVLGGGSNLLFTKNIFDGLVIKNEIKGIEILKENDDHCWLKVGAGEGWHDFVLYCVKQQLGGVENLSLIPGSVGAAPMQNIGAYGAEVKDTIESVTAFEFEKGTFRDFPNQECAFGYRESYFKNEGKNRYFITHVCFKLSKRNHIIKTEYGAIKEFLTKMNINELSLKAVSDAVIAIRQSKLPDPAKIGNAGSFFKNPTITLEQYEILKQKHAAMPMFAVDALHVKVPAAWLIEQSGWKGKTFDKVGVHTQQALVLVNYGHGKGKDILELATKIQANVESNFGIKLNMEVNIV
ncbi:UDP-N-acetylmuramate dehydrogenase [Chryseotalea sanaruensis]|uniref:UDP-N-acetylenolpyruvoylglucosamine reductase n=1 Tax=Chryseotalea sanaruensis TaxID=2482724 RepID=A0A401U6J2_9BACT|nr:UDP-N-acetylmuramate dehydrogenase [Chryseotalea sanaruensis]GCC50548.1 UDP-N-acetylmuramate dehydrogenase [Chryseotalea sanaruensis]